MKLHSIPAFIFCRGGSKGIPFKNLQEINGSSLLKISIDLLKNNNFISEIYLSTDSKTISDEGKANGATIIKRPDELATDFSDELLSWQHAVKIINYNGPFIVTPVTSPLRNNLDIQLGIEKYFEGNYDIVFGVTEPSHNPFLNMVIVEKEFIFPLNKTNMVSRRQDAPKVFGVTTLLYVTNTDYLLSTNKLLNGKCGFIEIPNERAIDIDTKFDLELARILYDARL